MSVYTIRNKVYTVVFMIVLCMIIMSCSVQHDFKDSTQTIDTNINLKYEQVAKFCDDRYGNNTPEAEAYFKDYRDFLNIRIGLDLDSVVEYCSNTYTLPEEVEQCEADVISIIGNFDQIGGIE